MLAVQGINLYTFMCQKVKSFQPSWNNPNLKCMLWLLEFFYVFFLFIEESKLGHCLLQKTLFGCAVKFFEEFLKVSPVLEAY